ncbi:MAG: hypothetical protein K2Q23_11860 [Bryobacteraceae bacterium]|nr:hypothetical protein [Bryobacteraceae bacterium]
MIRMREDLPLVRWVVGIVFAGFAIGIAIAAVSALVMVYRAVTAEERQVRIEERHAEIGLEQRSYNRSRGKYQALVMTESLVLADAGRRYRARVTTDLNKDTFFTRAFLDAHRPGDAVWVTVARDGQRVDLETGSDWKKVLGLGVLVLFLGWFAWILWPVVRGRDMGRGIGWKFAAAGVVMIASVGFALYHQSREKAIVRQIPREPVSGTVKGMPLAQALGELEASGVKLQPGVKSLFSDPVWYCAYEFAGRPWRAQSLWCQGTEGDRVEGRVNRNDPRDVRWASEPD